MKPHPSLNLARMILIPVALLVAAYAEGASREHWVATWTAAQLLAQPAQAAGRGGGPGAGARSFANQTVRMIVRSTIGGRRARVKFANAFGGTAVTIGSAHLARRAKGPETVSGSDRALAFGGKSECTIQPGQVLYSDPVDLDIQPLTDLTISVYFPRETGPVTLKYNSLHTTYISKEGDATGQSTLEYASTSDQYYYLAGVEVMAPENVSLIVTLGDSITDGDKSTKEENRNWPSLLAKRLQVNPKTAMFAVGSAGISGNRMLRDMGGVSVLARFERDVLGQSGVKWLMVLEGINDIGMGGRGPADPSGRDDLIGAYTQIIERAHAAGIKVVGCTIVPFEGAFYYRDAGENTRSAVNERIRTSKAFDAVVDFDAAVRDPANPKRLRAAFDSGDHLHPNDAGYEAMANAIDLKLFLKN